MSDQPELRTGQTVYWVSDKELYDSKTELYPTRPIPPVLCKGVIRSCPKKGEADVYTLLRDESLMSWHHRKHLFNRAEEAITDYMVGLRNKFESTWNETYGSLLNQLKELES